MWDIIVHLIAAAALVYGLVQRRRNTELELEVAQLERANAELEQRIAELTAVAGTDALTGIANRRGFDQALERAYREVTRKRMGKQETSLRLLILDLDDFKPVNDRYGHPAGDAILKKMADILQQIFGRPRDVVARIGGDEFAVILQDVSTRSVASLQAKLFTLVGKELAYEGHHVGASVGHGALVEGEGLADFIDRVDALARRAKEGKGR